MPIIRFEKKIEEITIEPGEVLTVWLNTSLTGRRAIQVEMRSNTGIPEIYTRIGNVTIKDFDEYPY